MGQLLTDLNLVGVVQCAAISVEDTHVFVRVAIELLADLRERIARFDRIALTATSTADCCAHRTARINTDVSSNVVLSRADELDLIPELALGLFCRRDAFDEELIVLHMQVLKLHVLLIGGSQYRLVLLFQLVKPFLRIGLLAGCFGAVSEHLIEYSHFFLRLFLTSRAEAPLI